jgi:hypothetical protein
MYFKRGEDLEEKRKKKQVDSRHRKCFPTIIKTFLMGS